MTELIPARLSDPVDVRADRVGPSRGRHPGRVDDRRVGRAGSFGGAAGAEPQILPWRLIGNTEQVVTSWRRLRHLAILVAILFGVVGPAQHRSEPVRIAVYVLAGLVVLGWLLPYLIRWIPAAPTASVVVYGSVGAVLAGVQPDGAALAFPAIACINASVQWPLRRALGFAGALSVGYAGVLAVTQPGRSPWLLLLGPALFGAATLAGVSRAQNTRLAAQAERERARAAALDERARIAREIHDILAHALAALSVQLETADALLEGGRTGQAQESVRRAGKLAREGLTETRRAIGALRGDSVPLPDLLNALVASYESNVETPVRVHVTGAPRPLEPDAVLALYRTAQEALTNAQKHAPGAAIDLELAFDPGEVRLSVVNGAPVGAVSHLASAGGGYGLAGLRERAELAGGSLVAGPAGDGYRVGVTIPA